MNKIHNKDYLIFLKSLLLWPICETKLKLPKPQRNLVKTCKKGPKLFLKKNPLSTVLYLTGPHPGFKGWICLGNDPFYGHFYFLAPSAYLFQLFFRNQIQNICLLSNDE